MGKDLPARADQFLCALSRELHALSSFERETVLLELRCHLFERAAQSEEALDAALQALGRPVDLAKEFDLRQGARLAPVPKAFSIPWRRMRMSEVIGEVRATWFASRNGLVTVELVLIALLAATQYVTWTTARTVETEGGIPTMLAVLAVQMVGTMLAMCAGYRVVLSNEPRPWRITPSTFRFVGAMIAVDFISLGPTMVIEGLITGQVAAAGATHTTVMVGRVVVTALVTAALFCVALRIQPWLVALAIGRRGLTLAASWKGTSGRMLNILRGWVGLVLPLYILGFGVNSVGLEMGPTGIWLPALAGLSGILGAAITVAAVLLNATIFRWAVGEPIPSARRWAGEAPGTVPVGRFRARLATLDGKQDRIGI